MSKLIVPPSHSLKGSIKIPGDKSLSHRAVILGAIAEGITTIQGLLEGEDVLCTIDCMKALGAKIEKVGNGKWKIEGVGKRGLQQPQKVLYCGNSGTTLRLLSGLISGFPILATLTGDTSLNARPMKRVMDPLQKMGAKQQESILDSWSYYLCNWNFNLGILTKV